MRRLTVGIVIALLLHGCVSVDEREDEREQEARAGEQSEAQSEAQAPSFEETLLADPTFDGVFVVPGTDFSRYDSIILTELNLSEWRPAGRALPLKELNRNDRAFMSEQYTQAMVHYVTQRGDYQLSVDPGESVLQVVASLHQGVQPGGGELGQASRGNIVMLINWELYDSVTGRLVATMTSRQPVDRTVNERSSPLTAMQVNRAFSRWAVWFESELSSLRAEGQP